MNGGKVVWIFRGIIAIADGVIEATDIATMLTDLKHEKRVIERRLDTIEENNDISFRLTMTQSMIKELVEKVRNEQNVNVCRRLMRNIIDKIVVKGKTFSIYYSDKVITLINEDSDPDDFDGGSGGNKNNPNNDNNGSESDKNPKSSLRDGLVEYG